MKQLILFLLCLSTWTAQAKIYNVKDYGAKADGTTIDSPAINRADRKSTRLNSSHIEESRMPSSA